MSDIQIQKIFGMILGAMPFLAGFLLVPAIGSWWSVYREAHRKPTYFQPLRTDHFLNGAITITVMCAVFQTVSFVARRILIRSDNSGMSVGYWRVLFATCNLVGVALGVFALAM